MTDLERRRLTVRVLELLDESFRALRRRWLYLRLRLPWRLFRLARPSETLVLDWRYVHWWSRAAGPEPGAREWSDRLTPKPVHLCRDGRCGCPVSVRVAASARVEVSP